MVDDPSTAPLHITSEYAPDLRHVERFIRQKFAEGALALLLAAVMALLTRMRDLNTELLKQLALGRRKRPPSETMRRLQMELPFLGTRLQPMTASPLRVRSARSAGPRHHIGMGVPSSQNIWSARSSGISSRMPSAFARAAARRPRT